jgi:hypothetical protein
MPTVQNFNQSLLIAAQFAKLAAMATANSNSVRRQIADANIAAETFQADLNLRQTRLKLAQAYSEHVGTLAVNAAYRGSSIGDASPQAALLSATLRASNEVAVAEANKAATVASVIARNQFVEEDVTLASIEGGLRGFNVGLGIASALEEMTQVQRETRVKILDAGPGLFGFSNVVQDVAITPGLDLSGFNFGLDF